MPDIHDINDISTLLGVLGSGGGSADTGSSGNTESGGNGLFDELDLDPEMLLKLLEIFSKLNEPDKNAALLTALRPLLREENRPKLDRAARILKLLNILPLLRDSGLTDGLFRNIL